MDKYFFRTYINPEELQSVLTALDFFLMCHDLNVTNNVTEKDIKAIESFRKEIVDSLTSIKLMEQQMNRDRNKEGLHRCMFAIKCIN